MEQKCLYSKIFILIFVFFTSFMMLGQVQNKVDFKLRKSQQAPGSFKNTDVYHLQGDFTMIGNANLFDNPYTNDGSNSNNSKMSFYKLPGDPSSIKNSSSANLELPTGANRDCTKIVYAGLYWSGRGDNNLMTLSNGLVKNKIKIKLPGKTTYEELETSDIHFGGSDVGGMYTGYIDITDKVRNLNENSWGTYSVADVATTVGNGGSIGYYGGWGIVIIYENPTMKWKDITVFDGFSQIAHDGAKECIRWNNSGRCAQEVNKTTFGELEVTGFKASQTGDVRIKMGMMAGEGDRSIQGDVFDILKKTPSNPSNSDWYRLSHSSNSENDFFNSSILTGGNQRVPNLLNNYGMDVVMFDLPNANNQIIANNQTRTKFRFGTTQDTYIIYNIVFAVDAYVPEIVGENKPTNFGSGKPINDGTINPGQEFEFELDVYNKGTEAVRNSIIEIPVPANLHYFGADVESGPSNGTGVTWVPPVGGTNDPSVTAGGKIVWNIGTLPLDTSTNKNTILAKLKYRFKVSTDCILLSTAGDCGLEVRINGKISGTGVTSGSTVNSALVRDYGSGTCAGPVYDDFRSKISLSQEFLQNCNPPVENGVMQFRAFCSVPADGFSREEVTIKYPSGTKFFSSVPAFYASPTDIVPGNFLVSTNGNKTMYYVMTPGMEAGCYARLEVSVELVTTSPTAKNITLCQGEPIVLQNELSQIGASRGYALLYYSADNDSSRITGTPNPTTAGTYTYYVAEGKDGCIGSKKPFTITINPLPEVAKNVQNIEVCTNFDTEMTIGASTGTGVSYVWEYSKTGGTTWQTLTNTTLSNKVIVSNNKIELKYADSQLNGVKLRLNVSNSNKCTTTSNVFEIKVNDCPVVTNPMLLNPAIQ